MKRFTLSILMLCSTIMMTAEPVGKQSALYTAQNYMLAKGKTIQSAQPSFKSTRKGAAQASDDAYYYVFNAGNDGGYVIVSGDDRTEPILGYVDHGSFDPENIPENMRSWLQGYSDEIKYIVENNIQQGDPRIKKRNKVRGTKHSVPELLTTRWNQGRPYNLTCPDYYLEKDKKEETSLPLRNGPATGCTATAMAQTMAYYRYPDKTKAIIPAYSITYTSEKDGSKKTTTQKAIPRNTPIDWDNMFDTYSWEDGHVANVHDSAVANLMHYCGQAVNMHYGPSSGANFNAEVFIKYFGYDNSAYRGNRSDYSIDDWFDMCYKDISEGYPVCFAGFSSGGGHAFVLDGFDGDNLFHVNWGWGGGSNGWFLVGILNPGDNSGIGASSSSDGYSMGQYALFNLRLPDTNSADTYLFIKDVTTTGTSIKATFENRTGASGSFHTGIVRMEDDGTYSLVGSQQTISGMANNTTQTKTFAIKGKLPEGTYKLSPASKATRNTEWRPKYNLYNHYIEAVVDSEGNVTLTPVDINNGNDISIDTIVFPGTRIVGKEQEVKVTYRNNGNEYFREIHFFASKTQDKIYTEHRAPVAVRKGETVDVSYFFKPEETGTYNLWFCTSNNGSGVVGQGTVEIIEEAQAVKANLSVSSMTVTNLVSSIAYGNRLVGKVSIRNNAKVPYNGGVRLQIWTQYGGSGSAYSGSSQTHNIDVLAGKVATVDFTFDNLAPDNKYFVAVNYVNQDGSLTSGGVWDHGWMMKDGLCYWKYDGTIAAMAYKSTISFATATASGVYANCTGKISRLTPSRNNPNVIYAFGEGKETPANLDTTNVVKGKHADHICLINSKPYYVPVSFDADTASYTYTFPETEKGTGWHAITMPFEVDSIYVDDEYVSLDDTLKHFWIYEFTAEGDNGEVIFAPAKVLRGATPYIIAADSTMAGRSIVFRSLDVPFFKTGSDKMVVTSPDYQFHGTTFAPKLKDCYMLNEEGTAFEYVTTTKTLNAQSSYFTTNLPEELQPESIVLPDVPVVQMHVTTLDEMATNEIVAGKYDQITLKRAFEAGWNTICLPFEISDVETIFGEGSKAYSFLGFVQGELDFLITDKLEAGQPYIIYLPNAITEDIVLTDIQIDASNTSAGYIFVNGAYFHGTYFPFTEIVTRAEVINFYVLNTDGSITIYDEEAGLGGFRGYFELPVEEGEEEVILRPYDDPTGINSISNSLIKGQAIYNLAGQRLNKTQKGINIVNGKKIIIK